MSWAFSKNPIVNSGTCMFRFANAPKNCSSVLRREAAAAHLDAGRAAVGAGAVLGTAGQLERFGDVGAGTILETLAEGAQPLRLLLDAEPQQPGKDEMAAALRFGGFWRRIHGPLMSCWPTLFTPAPAL